MVRADGTVRLGSYGVVPVAGKSPSQVEAAVVAHLRRFLHQPAVRVTVSAPNSQAVAGSRPRP